MRRGLGNHASEGRVTWALSEVGCVCLRGLLQRRPTERCGIAGPKSRLGSLLPETGPRRSESEAHWCFGPEAWRGSRLGGPQAGLPEPGQADAGRFLGIQELPLHSKPKWPPCASPPESADPPVAPNILPWLTATWAVPCRGKRGSATQKAERKGVTTRRQRLAQTTGAQKVLAAPAAFGAKKPVCSLGRGQDMSPGESETPSYLETPRYCQDMPEITDLRGCGGVGVPW